MKKSIIITICAIIFLQLSIPIVYAINNPDYTENIGPGQIFAVKIEIRRKTKVVLQVEVISGGNLDIDVYILDTHNYNEMMNGFSFSYIEGYSMITSASITNTLESGDYWFVFSNAFSIITTKTVEIKLDFSYFNDIAETFNWLPIVIGCVIGLIVSVPFIVVKKRKKSEKPLVQQQIELNNGLIFCSGCGQKIKKESLFCEFCGIKS